MPELPVQTVAAPVIVPAAAVPPTVIEAADEYELHELELVVFKITVRNKVETLIVVGS
jgi:hypothetical protein